jgi:hypothetical protein
VATVAAVLTVLGVALLLAVLVPSDERTFDLESAVKLIGACVAGYCFYLVGKSIWRDIKKRPPG